MIYLLEGQCTISDHSLKAAVSCMLCARNLKFTEHDNKVIVCVTSWGQIVVITIISFHYWLMTRFVTIVAPEFTPVFSGVRVARSLVLWVMFCKSLFILCSFSFGHYSLCPSSIYGFWLPFWYLQTFDHYICLSFLDLRFLITPFTSSNLWPLHCLCFDLRLLITILLSSIF